MNIIFHASFVKQYKKLRPALKVRFKERRNLFLENPFHPILNNHPLRGKYDGYRSINITGDLRVVYKHIALEFVLFAHIGTHSELYS